MLQHACAEENAKQLAGSPPVLVLICLLLSFTTNIAHGPEISFVDFFGGQGQFLRKCSDGAFLRDVLRAIQITDSVGATFLRMQFGRCSDKCDEGSESRWSPDGHCAGNLHGHIEPSRICHCCEQHHAAMRRTCCNVLHFCAGWCRL